MEAELRAPRGMMFVILQGIARHPEQAYGAGICGWVSSRVGDGVDPAKVYVVLSRLTRQGLIEPIRPEKSGRGRPRQKYKLTQGGFQALASGEKLYQSPRYGS